MDVPGLRFVFILHTWKDTYEERKEKACREDPEVDEA